MTSQYLIEDQFLVESKVEVECIKTLKILIKMSRYRSKFVILCSTSFWPRLRPSTSHLFVLKQSLNRNSCRSVAPLLRERRTNFLIYNICGTCRVLLFYAFDHYIRRHRHHSSDVTHDRSTVMSFIIIRLFSTTG